MITKIKHIPSGRIYENRKDAKLEMGRYKYDKALHNGKMLFVNTYSTSDIII